MPYYELPPDPKLTIQDVRTKLAAEMQSDIAMRRGYVLVESRETAVAVHLAQRSGRTFLRVDGAFPRGSYVRPVLAWLIPPAGLATLYLMKNPKFPLFTAVEYSLCQTTLFPGIRRLPSGIGTRLARPVLNVLLQLGWIAAGLWLAATGIDWSSHWLGQPGRPFKELVPPAFLFTLGGVWVVTGACKLFRPPLGWLAIALIAAALALLSPLVFRAWPR